MSLPGSTVTSLTNAPARLAPVASGVGFMVGFAEQGDHTKAVAVTSLDDFKAVGKYGARVSYSYLYDSVETFFRIGGSKLYIGRAIGPSPVYATHTFLSTTPDNALVVTAKWYGDYGNSISVAILTGSVSGYRVQVSYLGTIVETSTDLTTQADAVTWAAGSQYVNIAVGSGTHVPTPVSATALASGTDDHASATDAQKATALALFSKDLGPGQVAIPGTTTATSHANLIAHAVAKNRTAFLDYADTSDRATLVTAAGVDRLVSGSDSAAGFAPWALIPGLTSGLTRTVPYSAVQMGLVARNDNAGVSPNQPSAGSGGPTPGFGQPRFVVGLSQLPWAGTAGGDRELLNNAGINVARTIAGAVTTYGYRTLADPAAQNGTILLLSNRRLIMTITDLAQKIGDTYVFRLIDGLGHLQADFAGDLKGMLTPFYTDGSLFGATPADAFSVDVGPNVNTPTTIAALELHSALYLSLSPYAEKVPIQIVSTPIEQGVS